MERKGILEIFATHPVLMNVLMFIVICVGLVSLSRINFQFFPTFDVPIVTVTTQWPGAAAEDVEQSITNRLELELANIDNLKSLTSSSRFGFSQVIMEFNEDTDLRAAKDRAEQLVGLASPSLPEEAEEPEVTQFWNYEPVASLIVSARTLDQVRSLAYQFKEELLDSGIGKVDVDGLPKEEVAILIPSSRLRELRLDLNQIGEKIRSSSIDVPIGILGRDDAARQLRFVQQRRGELEFTDIPVIADDNGSLIKLKDIADIQRRPKNDQLTITYQGRPAAVLNLKRLETSDTIESAQTLYDWLEQRRQTLPPTVQLHIHDDRSLALKSRLSVLVKNGLVGLVLVLGVLFVFLSTRLAFWVAAGIPVAILGGIALLYGLGGSLNMVSMFAFIMMLGIIVDDAIVVGEDALLKYQGGFSPADSVQAASRVMFLPILAASLTTIFAFIPVLVIPGIIGTVVSAIGLVVFCVVVISVVEAFLILPGHLHHSFKGIQNKAPSKFSQWFNSFYYRFQNGLYYSAVSLAIKRPILTISIGVACLILTIGLFGSGKLQYNFFPTPELDRIFMNAVFFVGTPKSEIDEYLVKAEQALLETEKDLGGNLISTYYIQHGAVLYIEDRREEGNHLGSIILEITPSDEREVRTSQFLQTWQSKLDLVPGQENLILSTPAAGPPGSDIEIYFRGKDREAIKTASVEFSEYLRSLPGVYGIKEDTSFGYQQRVMTLTSKGEALGLTVREISRQLRSAIEGRPLQSYTLKQDEIDVVPRLPDAESDFLSTMENLHIRLPSGQPVPLSDVVKFESKRGFGTLFHSGGVFTVTVSADVDATQNNSNLILRDLEDSVLPELVKKYGVEWLYGEATTEQRKTEDALKVGAILAFVLIYLTLTAIFGSYIWPVFVMLSIPFGIVGAAWGHYILGITVSFITVLGFIGLSGIVVNNAIVLIVQYKKNIEQGMKSKTAMTLAGIRRLRPVILSTITTVAGLAPLLFEKSTQAQFLIPMVVTITFGLAFATLLILLFIPAVVTLFDTNRAKYQKHKLLRKFRAAEVATTT